MAKRQVFFSFHYDNDAWRAGQVRNMKKVDKSSTFSDNDWEEVKTKTGPKIKEWINSQLDKRSCLVVLIGKETSERKWIKYEIETALEKNKGIVGIYIHGLLDKNKKQSKKGKNPFDSIKYKGKKVSEYEKVVCYNSPYTISSNVYNDISDKMEDLIEDAYNNRPDSWD